MSRTLGLLTERRALLERTARRLLEKETLEEVELLQLVEADARWSDRAIIELGGEHRDARRSSGKEP